MASYIALSYWDLAVASVLILIDAALSIIFGLRIHRSLLVAAIRMTVQLALVGLVLTFLFAVVSPLWTGLAALGMILFAGLEITQRQERRLSGWWSYGLGTGCMMISSVAVTVFALLTALRPTPWSWGPLQCSFTSHPYDEPREPARKRGGSTHARCDAMECRRARDPGGASQRLDAHDKLHVSYRAGILAGHDDWADPGRGTPVRGGKIPNPGDVPNCGGNRAEDGSGRAWRRFPSDGRPSSAASRSDSCYEAHLADPLRLSSAACRCPKGLREDLL